MHPLCKTTGYSIKTNTGRYFLHEGQNFRSFARLLFMYRQRSVLAGDKIGKDKLGEQTRQNTWRGHLQLFPDLSEYLSGDKNRTHPNPRVGPNNLLSLHHLYVMIFVS